MLKCEFTFLGSNGKTNIHAVKWMPENSGYHAILQITHGMVEFIERYEPFAEFLTQHGYMVVGHDHLGHGDSIRDVSDFGYFREENPSDGLIKDMHKLRTIIQDENPDVPYFMLGHSMGSFLVRRYLSIYKDGPDGFILMGTGAPAEPMVASGKILASIMAKVKGERYRSKLLYEMSLGSYNRKFKPTKTPQDWLTRDESWAQSFGQDELCQFIFTATAYREFFRVILLDSKAEKRGNIRTDAPIMIVSGDKDPVGDDAKGVRIVYDRYSDAGAAELTLGLYEGARHEILHETNREEVFGDILEWMEQFI